MTGWGSLKFPCNSVTFITQLEYFKSGNAVFAIPLTSSQTFKTLIYAPKGHCFFPQIRCRPTNLYRLKWKGFCFVFLLFCCCWEKKLWLWQSQHFIQSVGDNVALNYLAIKTEEDNLKLSNLPTQWVNKYDKDVRRYIKFIYTKSLDIKFLLHHKSQSIVTLKLFEFWSCHQKPISTATQVIGSTSKCLQALNTFSILAYFILIHNYPSVFSSTYQNKAGATFYNSFFDNCFGFLRQCKNRSFLGSVFIHATGRSQN